MVMGVEWRHLAAVRGTTGRTEVNARDASLAETARRGEKTMM